MSLCGTPLPGQVFRLPTLLLPNLFQGPLAPRSGSHPGLSPVVSPSSPPSSLPVHPPRHCVSRTPEVLDLPGKPPSPHQKHRSKVHH